MEDVSKLLGIVGAAAMPLFNIPLMIKIFRRRSCADISLLWVFGVWSCIALMFPSSLQSSDLVLKVFGISNLLLFSGVVLTVSYFRWRPAAPKA